MTAAVVERDACSPSEEAVGVVAGMLALAQPTVVVETGMGRGFFTRAGLAAVPYAEWWCIESDAAFHAYAPPHDEAALADDDRLEPPLARIADFVILDSHPNLRGEELATWHAYARPGCWLWLDDAHRFDAAANLPGVRVHGGLLTRKTAP